jgi:hypothetical protein
MTRRLAVALAAAALAACGKPLLYARLDAPSVTVTQALPALPGAPAVDGTAVLPPGGVDFPVGDLVVDRSFQGSRVTLNGAALAMTGSGGGPSFAGIRRAVLRVTAPGGALVAADLASFDAVRDGAAGATLALRPETAIDLLPYLSAQALHLELELSGTPPGPEGTSWTADLTLDFHLVAQVGYP